MKTQGSLRITFSSLSWRLLSNWAFSSLPHWFWNTESTRSTAFTLWSLVRTFYLLGPSPTGPYLLTAGVTLVRVLCARGPNALTWGGSTRRISHRPQCPVSSVPADKGIDSLTAHLSSNPHPSLVRVEFAFSFRVAYKRSRVWLKGCAVLYEGLWGEALGEALVVLKSLSSVLFEGSVVRNEVS